MGTPPLERCSVERVELPSHTVNGEVRAEVSTLSEIAAALVNADPCDIRVDKATIKDVKGTSCLTGDGKLVSRQRVKLELEVDITTAARLALGASAQFKVDNLSVEKAQPGAPSCKPRGTVCNDPRVAKLKSVIGKLL
ncbi:MAG: hypothetical protein AAFQ82_17465 [Myxococcota bacterium]